MENNYKIYAYINLINGKIYIGQTKQSLNARAGKNGNGYRQCVLFYSAINKHGFQNFKPFILIDGLNKEAADYLEISLIKEFNSTNPDYGYNIAKGGQFRTNGFDISNQKFGKLTARYLVDDPRRGRYWYCDCDCGGFSIVRQEHLRDGTASACADCTLKSHSITPNKIEFIDNDIIKVLLSDGYFLIDKESYDKIKHLRWYKSGEYSVSSTTGERKSLLKYLFPEFKKREISNYITFKDGNRFNFCNNNLCYKILNNSSQEDWLLFLKDNDTNIRFVKHCPLKPWLNVTLGKYYSTYNEAKHGVKGSDIDVQ